MDDGVGRMSWLKAIYPEFKLETWHFDRVKHPLVDVKNLEYYNRRIEYKACINPQLIVGIDYFGNYNYPIFEKPVQLNWLGLFLILKRFNYIEYNFKNLDEVIYHIHNNKEPKIVEKFGQQYFTKGGQHRLCLAKFIGIKEIEVKLIEHIFDQRLFELNKINENYLPILQKYSLVEVNSFSSLIDLEKINICAGGAKFTIPADLIVPMLKIYDQINALRDINWVMLFKSHLTVYMGKKRSTLENIDDLQGLKAYFYIHIYRQRKLRE